MVLEVLGSLAEGGIAGFLRGLLDRQAEENSRYLLEALTSEVEYLGKSYQALDERHWQFLNTDWIALLADAERKARQARGAEKIRRLARIVVHPAVVGPVADASDTAEEMMRTALRLDEQDVLVLRTLVEYQGDLVAQNDIVPTDD
jgi:hypothetical protein